MKRFISILILSLFLGGATALPPATDFTNAATQGDFKTALTALRGFLAGVLGADGTTATVRTTIGLGTIATQASSNISITGGNITGITDLAVADGGTGSSTAALARTALGVIIFPAGAMVNYGGSSAPSGWVFCNGGTYNSVGDTTFADLFTAIGTTYGGTGSNDFDVPDLRGRFGLGKDNMGGSSANRVVETEADNLGQGSGQELQTTASNHAHGGGSHQHNVNLSGSTAVPSATGNAEGGSQTALAHGNHTHLIQGLTGDTTNPTSNDTTEAGVKNNTNMMNPYVTVNCIIKK